MLTAIALWYLAGLVGVLAFVIHGGRDREHFRNEIPWLVATGGPFTLLMGVYAAIYASGEREGRKGK